MYGSEYRELKSKPGPIDTTREEMDAFPPRLPRTAIISACHVQMLHPFTNEECVRCFASRAVGIVDVDVDADLMFADRAHGPMPQTRRTNSTGLEVQAHILCKLPPRHPPSL